MRPFVSLSAALLALASLAAVASVPACGNSDSTHPGNVSDCEENCGPAVIGGPGAAGSGGAAGAAGAAGSAGAAGQGGGGAGGAAVAGVHATGTVVVFTNSTFTTTAVYALPALVQATAFDPSVPPSAPWDGMSSFTLQNVAAGSATVFSAKPAAAASDTLAGAVTMAVPSTGLDMLTIPVVDTGVISAILGTLPGSPALNPTAGHVVISFVDDQKSPISNITVTPSFAGTLVYDDGPNYSDGKTRARGVAALFNATPAATNVVTYTTSDNRTGSVSVQVAAGLVYFTTVVIPTP
jgi:hypothetical protein